MVLQLEYQGGLIGPSTMPVVDGMDTMAIPVRYPLNPGQVGVSGRLAYPGQEVPTKNEDGTIGENPAFREAMNELEGAL